MEGVRRKKREAVRKIMRERKEIEEDFRRTTQTSYQNYSPMFDDIVDNQKLLLEVLLDIRGQI